jgi:hypothetical protein
MEQCNQANLLKFTFKSDFLKLFESLENILFLKIVDTNIILVWD